MLRWEDERSLAQTELLCRKSRSYCGKTQTCWSWLVKNVGWNGAVSVFACICSSCVWPVKSQVFVKAFLQTLSTHPHVGNGTDAHTNKKHSQQIQLFVVWGSVMLPFLQIVNLRGSLHSPSLLSSSSFSFCYFFLFQLRLCFCLCYSSLWILLILATIQTDKIETERIKRVSNINQLGLFDSENIHK